MEIAGEREEKTTMPIFESLSLYVFFWCNVFRLVIIIYVRKLLRYSLITACILLHAVEKDSPSALFERVEKKGGLYINDYVV